MEKDPRTRGHLAMRPTQPVANTLCRRPYGRRSAGPLFTASARQHGGAWFAWRERVYGSGERSAMLVAWTMSYTAPRRLRWGGNG